MRVFIAIATAPDYEGIPPLMRLGRTKRSALARLNKEMKRLADLDDEAEDSRNPHEFQIDLTMWVDIDVTEQEL